MLGGSGYQYHKQSVVSQTCYLHVSLKPSRTFQDFPTNTGQIPPSSLTIFGSNEQRGPTLAEAVRPQTKTGSGAALVMHRGSWWLHFTCWFPMWRKIRIPIISMVSHISAISDVKSWQIIAYIHGVGPNYVRVGVTTGCQGKWHGIPQRRTMSSATCQGPKKSWHSLIIKHNIKVIW